MSRVLGALRVGTWSILGSFLGVALYYRPVPCTSIDGPKRDGYFLSKKNLSDYSDEKPGLLYSLAQSIATFLTVSTTRAFLMYAGSFEVVKDENYYHFLSSIINRSADTGVLTVANHRSMFDDPAILSSILPYWINIQPKYLRWDVCSQEYCFNSKIPALFHGYVGLGKTLPIWRGGGINQKFLLDLGRHLAAGEWCHLFPEAGVFQRPTLGGRRNGKEGELGKLKWGVGKLIAHAPNKIIVIPFFHTGMETVIPQDQTTMKTIGLPIPRPGHNVTVRFGKEIRFDDLIQEHEAKYGKLRKYSAQASQQDLDNFHDSWDSVPQDYALYHKITFRIQQALEDLNAVAVTK